jgi:ABC-type lipoprotein release transport system permease subunit
MRVLPYGIMAYKAMWRLIMINAKNSFRPIILIFAFLFITLAVNNLLAQTVVNSISASFHDGLHFLTGCSQLARDRGGGS